MGFKVEKDWTAHGFQCVVLGLDMGHRAGYVGVPRSHPLYGVGYATSHPALKASFVRAMQSPIGKRGIIPILLSTCGDADRMTPDFVFDVHGGITYAEGDGKYPVENSGVWWFGFDCAHSGDARDLSLVDEERRELVGSWPSDGVVRTTEYVADECESLAAQLAEIRPSWRDRIRAACARLMGV